MHPEQQAQTLSGTDARLAGVVDLSSSDGSQPDLWALGTPDWTIAIPNVSGRAGEDRPGSDDRCENQEHSVELSRKRMSAAVANATMSSPACFNWAKCRRRFSGPRGSVLTAASA